MGRIPEETISQIRDRAGIVEVAQSFFPVKKRGGDYWACCPFHHEKTPSFKLNEDRNAYYCFGCKAHGTVFDLVKALVNTDFVGAVRWLAQRYNIEIPEERYAGLPPDEAARQRQIREKRLTLLQTVAEWYRSLIRTPEAAVARNYLAGRGMDEPSADQFKLGYSPDAWDGIIRMATTLGYDTSDLLATGLIVHNEEKDTYYDRFRGRLMFPIWNEMGKVVGFSARILDPAAKTAKYVNSPETEFFEKGRLLYAFNFARDKLREFGHALVCEGQLDVIACHRAGLVNAVAAQGTAFTEAHARLLRKSVDKVVLSFDADTAGFKAARRTIALLHGLGFTVEVVTLPEGEDPDSVFRKGGADALRQIMSVTEPAVHYLFRVSCLESDIRTAEGKSIIVNQVLAGIQPLKDLVARTAHCQWLARQLGLPDSTVINTLASMPGPDAPPHPGGAPARPHPPPVFIAPVAPSDVTWGMLLDLVLHFEDYAKRLAFDDAMMSLIPPSPLGQALSHVLAFAEQGEWGSAADRLSQMPLFQDAMVGHAIIASDFAKTAEQGEESQRIERTFQDCLARIKQDGLTKRINQLQEEMAKTQDEQQRRDLQSEMTRLVIEKKRFRNALRQSPLSGK
ncbi:MAG: DNA primase [Victivallales bacterium]|nr:DNA primase [Victivallales bacterium]